MAYLGNQVAPLVQALEGKELKLDSDGDSSIQASSDDTVVFKTNGSNRWTLNSSGNLFPASTSQGIVLGATSDTEANRLDEYEEGTHTITPNSNLTLDSSYNVLQYTKIGKSVTLSGYTKVSSVSGSDTVTMSIPFVVAANPTNGLGSATSQVMHNGVNVGDAGLATFALGGRSYLNFYNLNDNAGWTGLSNSNLAANDELYFTITYFTDS